VAVTDPVAEPLHNALIADAESANARGWAIDTDAT
jgi:hypothetical protein